MAEQRKRVSPYLEWAVLTEFAYLPGEWFWVLLELDEPAEAFARSVVRSGLDQFIRIPAVYQGAPPSLRGADLTCCMAIARREALSALVARQRIARRRPNGLRPCCPRSIESSLERRRHICSRRRNRSSSRCLPRGRRGGQLLRSSMTDWRSRMRDSAFGMADHG